MNFQLECNRNFEETAHGQPNPESINFQLECNRNFKQTAQGQPKPESQQFSIRMYKEFQGNFSERAQARISSIFN